MIEIRLAIVGVGRVAQYQIDAIDAVPGVKLVAACDLDTARLSGLPAAAARFGAVEELIRGSRYDLVVVSTPWRSHSTIARQLIEAGSAVLLEKPATSSLDEFDKLEAMASAADVYFNVALHAQYGLETLWFSQRFDEAVDSRVSDFSSVFNDPYAPAGLISGHGRSLGGPWIDSGINALSVLAGFVPMTSLSIAEVIPEFGSGEDPAIRTEVELHGGDRDDPINGVITVDWIGGSSKKSTELRFGPDMQLTLKHSEEEVWIHESGREPDRIQLANGLPRLVNHYVGVFESVAAALSDNARPNLREVRELHRVLLEGQEKIESCR